MWIAGWAITWTYIYLIASLEYRRRVTAGIWGGSCKAGFLCVTTYLSRVTSVFIYSPSNLWLVTAKELLPVYNDANKVNIFSHIPVTSSLGNCYSKVAVFGYRVTIYSQLTSWRDSYTPLEHYLMKISKVSISSIWSWALPPMLNISNIEHCHSLQNPCANKVVLPQIGAVTVIRNTFPGVTGLGYPPS